MKHIKKDDIKGFAGNIKKALREAYNVAYNVGSMRPPRKGNDAFLKRASNHTDQRKNDDINSRLLDLANRDISSRGNPTIAKPNVTQGRNDKELHQQIVNAFTQSMSKIFGYS